MTLGEADERSFMREVVARRDAAELGYPDEFITNVDGGW